MKYLLDTHVLLWYIEDSDKLRETMNPKISDLITLFSAMIQWGNKVDGYRMPLATEVVSSEKLGENKVDFHPLLHFPSIDAILRVELKIGTDRKFLITLPPDTTRLAGWRLR